MNVYVSKKYKENFLEKLKEIPIIDDYNLDSERLGKEKIKLQTHANANDVIMQLIDILPIDSMLVDQIEYPGKEYILCVGEISFSDFPYLREYDLNFSIITKKENTVRFNAWIHFTQLESIFHSERVIKFSSISGKIKEETFFIIESDENHMNELHQFVSNFSDEFIIKDNKIYVKLMIKDFTKIFSEIQNMYQKIEIIDERVY